MSDEPTMAEKVAILLADAEKSRDEQDANTSSSANIPDQIGDEIKEILKLMKKSKMSPAEKEKIILAISTNPDPEVQLTLRQLFAQESIKESVGNVTKKVALSINIASLMAWLGSSGINPLEWFIKGLQVIMGVPIEPIEP